MRLGLLEEVQQHVSPGGGAAAQGCVAEWSATPVVAQSTGSR
jgi:hypothetical protein